MGDEHYNFPRNVRGRHHVLATLDERTYNPGANAKSQDHPISWCTLYDGENVNDNAGTPKAYRDGRVWVTAMGHFGASYTENGGNNNLVKMIAGGTSWVAGGGKKTDCSGTVWPSYRRTVLVADANQPIGSCASSRRWRRSPGTRRPAWDPLTRSRRATCSRSAGRLSAWGRRQTAEVANRSRRNVTPSTAIAS